MDGNPTKARASQSTDGPYFSKQERRSWHSCGSLLIFMSLKTIEACKLQRQPDKELKSRGTINKNLIGHRGFRENSPPSLLNFSFANTSCYNYVTVFPLRRISRNRQPINSRVSHSAWYVTLYHVTK